ncbi:MAG: HAD-IC family P-type ATPase, partial [Lentimicrobium sp.]|nr:HAD-IC family P-type ATPase [Lentimicrobium sp.]
MTQKQDNQNTHKWHSMEAGDVVEKLKTDQEKGLKDNEVKERLGKYGRNEIPKGKKRTWWMRLLMQFNNVLIYVLIAAAIITALMDHWIDTWVILAVVIINALIGFLQEGKAERSLESIRKMLSLEAVVIRNGKKQTVDAEELVPGDVVMLKSGDKIPADIRLVKSKDLRVEESPLTGESTAVEKNTDP